MPRKEFELENPALNFIDTDTTEEEKNTEEVMSGATPATTDAQSIFDVGARRTKSRRLQLLLYPDVYERVKKQAKKHKLSVNDYVNIALDYISKEDNT